jgi:DNA (cytosine-5)-methyltransferase 1
VKPSIHQFPVIDLFAGPGGLSEGFASYADDQERKRFRIALSIEMERAAHGTLELRSFFRHLPDSEARADYYLYLKGNLSREELFAKYAEAATAARTDTWRFQLGRQPNKVEERIRSTLGERPRPWLLIGGPPCAAYSLAGRVHYRDGRRRWRKQSLYRHYLRVIATFAPSVFIMENVKGLLSSKLRSKSIFDQIIRDLTNPGEAIESDDAVHLSNGLNGRPFRRENGKARYSYRIFSFVRRSLVPSNDDFIIRAEDYGVPQRRHRVILLGVRSDLGELPGILAPNRESVSAADVLDSLPSLRSRLSDGSDSLENWLDALGEGAVKGVFDNADLGTLRKIRAALKNAENHRQTGARFLPGSFVPRKLSKELVARELRGVCNHESRSHMKEDLWRYLFASAYAEEHWSSPVLKNFPSDLLPDHRSVAEALKRSSGHFSDRFRVQLSSKPATTVTAHISKDGHYFIHYDPAQCRSLTVREAARLQTFPDDYFFEGSRTEQYTQVGNAVPPLLARQLAGIVCPLLDSAADDSRTPTQGREEESIRV